MLMMFMAETERGLGAAATSAAGPRAAELRGGVAALRRTPAFDVAQPRLVVLPGRAVALRPDSAPARRLPAARP
jgi:hypothetical protein